MTTAPASMAVSGRERDTDSSETVVSEQAMKNCITIQMPSIHESWTGKVYPIVLYDMETRKKVADSWWGETVTLPVNRKCMTIGINWGIDWFRNMMPHKAYRFQLQIDKNYELYWAPTWWSNLTLAVREC